MIGNFTEVKPLRYWVQHILPLVYDDSLSYMELLGKVVNTLNEVVKNNNLLPDYIMELIKEYISSGEIEKVLAEVLANYMLNVKFPPAGLKPATGDGSADDTEAIQGCIDYAASHGGMAVYFPSGSYLCGSLHIGGKCTMFGYDRYNTRIVMRGGVTEPLLIGNVDELSLNGLGFDGNMDIQVNNVNLIDITVGSGVVTNAFLTDGYDLLKANVTGDLTVSDVIFNHAVEHSLVVDGIGTVVVADCVFNTVSELIGKRYIKLGVNNSSVNGVVMKGACPVGVEVTGNSNRVQFNKGQCVKGYIDSGIGNTIIVDGVEKQEKYTNNVTLECGEYVRKSGLDDNLNVGGDRKIVVGGSITESCMVKTDSVTNKRTINSGSVEDSTTGVRTVNSKSVTETVELDSVEVITGDKNVSAGSVHIGSDMFDINIQGEKNEVVTGNVSEDYRADVTVTIGGGKNVTVTGEWRETANGNKTEDCNGNLVRHVVGTLNDSVDRDVNTLYKASEIKNVTGSSQENVGGTKQISAEILIENVDDINRTVTGNINEVVNGGKTIEVKMGETHTGKQLSILTDEPIKYGEVKNLSNLFNYVDAVDTSGVNYKILVATDAFTGFNEFSVKNYGAIGDGVTDDSAAFIDAMTANDIIYVPNGVYYLPNPILNNTELVNKSFIGESKSSVIKCDKEFMISSARTDSLNFLNLKFVGNFERYWSPCFKLSNAFNILFDNVEITDFKSACIWIDFGKHIKISRCLLHDSKVSAGVYLGSQSNTDKDIFAVVELCECYNNALDGIGVFGNYVSILNNHCHHNGLDNPRAAGIYGNGCTNAQIIGNKCDNNTGNGIDFIKSNQCLWAYNKCNNNQCCGVLITQGFYNSTIEHNTCSENGINPVGDATAVNAQKYEFFLGDAGSSLFQYNSASNGTFKDNWMYLTATGMTLFNNASSGFTGGIKNTVTYRTISTTEVQAS